MTPTLPRAIGAGWHLLFVATLALGTHSAEAQELRLIQAVKQHDIPAASKLIQHVDVNATAPDGATALHWAAHWDLIDVAETLLAAGAEPTRANDYGVAPLFLAATNGSARWSSYSSEQGPERTPPSQRERPPS